MCECQTAVNLYQLCFSGVINGCHGDGDSCLTLWSESFIKISAERLSCPCFYLKHLLNVAKSRSKCGENSNLWTYLFECGMNSLLVTTIIKDLCVRERKGAHRNCLCIWPRMSCYTAATEDIIYSISWCNVWSLPLPPPHSHGNFWFTKKNNKIASGADA